MRINNKKGFTIIEVVLSFTFAIIILASMFAIVINYQNRTEKEKIVSNLLTYKNGILEIVYQDVIGSNIESMETCGGKCIKINIKGNTNKPEDKVTYKLEGKVDADGNSYIEYRDNNYVLPDSKNDLSKIEDFGYQIDDDNKIYKIEIPITHAELDDEENEENTIEIVVSGKEFEKPVNKLDNPTKVTAVENIIYDDIEHELVEITKLKGVFYYSYDTVLDSNNYKDGSTVIPTKKEAGTYTIYYYIEGTDDYLAKSGIITVVISQRAVTFKADDASKGYDGTVLEKKTASLISGSLVEGHTATFDITGSIIEDGVVENVLNNVLIRDAKGNDVTKNYNITKVNGTLKITLVCEWVQKSTSTPTSCTATSKNSNPSNGDTYTYCSSKKYGDWRYSMVVNCNNGSSSTITSKYNFTSQSNASQACNSIPSNDSFCPGSAVNGRSCGTSQLVYYQKIVYEYQCSTKSDTVTLSNQEFSYTGSPVEVKDATSLSGTPITYEYYSSTDCSGEVMGEAPINVGTYSVKAISAGNANSTNQSGNLVYTGSSTCATVKINKGTPNVFLMSSTQEYTGNSLGTTASSTKPNGEHVELEYTYKYFTGNSCSGTALNGSPIDAGTYSVIATSKENNNLVSASSNCASFVVTPKVITYTSQASDKVYDGNTNATCTITLHGIAARDNVSATSTGTFDNKNAGQDKTVTCSNVTLTGTGVNNYKITSTSATTKANITQKTLTVANFTYSPLTKVYDGKTTVPSGFSVTGTTGSGVISGDNVIIGYTSAAYNDANVANANSITVSGLNISGTSASNYKLSATTYTKTGATITKATGTVSISAKTETYTGSAISIGTASTNSGGTVTYTYYNGESCGGTALSGAPTNAGTYSVRATVAATGNYTSATSSCVKLTINKISVTYKADDATKVYDGKALTKNTATLKSGALVSGHTATFTIEGSITNVGTVANVLKAVTIKNSSGTNVTANYNITMQNGTLTVTSAQGTVSLSDKSETYTGSAISIGTASTNSGGTVTYTYYSGESCSGAALSGAPKNVGKYSVKATLAATANYTTATSNCAKLTINAKALTYTASASNKTYDGNTSTTCSITLTGVVSGDSVSASAGSATFANKNVGTGKTVTCSNITLSGSSASNYTLSSTSTTTTANITAKVLTPLVSANSKIYDGGTGTSCFISFNAVVSGDSVSASAGSATFSDKNVGTGKTVTCSGITLSGTSAGNYKLSSTSVTTTASIAQKTLTVADFTYSPLTKVYNGNTSAPSGFKITASGVVSGDSVSVSYTSAAYNNANVANANSITVSGMNISGTSASNYKLSATTYTKTGASITKATGTVSISAKTETYTGSAISIGTASTNSGGTVTYTYYNGESCSGTALSGAPTNAGTYSVKATVAATGNYASATSSCVKLTINRISVTYKSDSASKIYDGTPLTKKTATLISGSLISGHTASFNITGTITNVGSTANTLSGVTIKNANGTDVSANYNITKQNGTLTITNPTVNINLSARTETYNGSAIAANTATTNSDGTITYTYYNGESCSGTALSGAPTNAGTYSVKATTSRTSNFPSATSACVKHTINQRAVTYKSDSASKAYDGTALTKKTATLISGSLVSGHTASFNITGTITNVGSTANTLSGVTIKNASGTDVSANYNITKQNGTLTITSVSATIPTNSLCVSRTYNGSAQQLTSVTSGTGYTLSDYSKTDAGTHTITATLKTGYTWSNNTTGTQTFTCSIAQKEVTYTADSATKQYDGAALTAQSATLTTGSLVSGHTATFSITGSQTSVGTSTNTLNSVTIKSGSTDVTKNYKITKVNGTLTVLDGTPPTITFSPNGNSKAAKSQSTKVTVTDNASTVSERKYLWSQSNNTSAENGTSFTSGQTITKSDDNGSWYLCIYAKDSTGNATNVCSNFFELDNTPPTITAGDFCTALGTSVDLSKNAVVTDDHQVTVTSSPQTLSTTSIGQTNITYTATDEAGNTTTKTVVASVYMKLDSSKAVTSGDGLYVDSLDTSRYIYKGTNPNNYVRFNGSNNWRILSIEADGTYKLIYMGTDLSSTYNSEGKGGTTFTGTVMDTLLNTTFYGSLSDTAKEMIVPHEFNYGLGNVSRVATTKLSSLYTNERKNKIATTVGLMTLTDFFRASNGPNCRDSQPLNKISGADNLYCNANNWLYTNGYEFWTFTPYNDYRMYHLTTTGGYTWDDLDYSHPYRPVVHISDAALFVDGDGSSGDPYVINTQCSGSVTITELKSCSIKGNSDDNIFEVSVVGGSGSFQYAWNGGAYQTSRKLSFSSVASGNPIGASVTVQDKKTSSTVTCSTTCTFTGWTSTGLSYFNYNAAYSKGEAEAANNTWYRTCNSGVLPTVCIQNGVNSGCYACTTYGRSISCS